MTGAMSGCKLPGFDNHPRNLNAGGLLRSLTELSLFLVAGGVAVFGSEAAGADPGHRRRFIGVAAARFGVSLQRWGFSFCILQSSGAA